MTRIGYNALFTPLIAKARVVQWIECRPPDSGADGSNRGVGRLFFLFIEKFTEYFLLNIFRLLFIFSLSFLYVFFVSSQENACISEFDLLLSTYSKWLYNDQFRSYLVYMIVYSLFPYNSFSKLNSTPNLIILVVTKFMLHVSQ